MRYSAEKILFPSILLLSFLITPEGVFSGETANPPYINDRGQLSYAEFLFNSANFEKAAREFERVIGKFPLSPLKERAQFGLADSYLRAGLYKEAQSEFRKFIGNFFSSPMAGEAVLKFLEAGKKAEDVLRGEKTGGGRQAGMKKEDAPQIREIRETRGMRGVQVMLFEGRSPEELAEEISRLKRAGVDTAIVRVFHNTGDRFHRFVEPKARRGVYFNSTHAPLVADALATVVDLAHREGLKVFAWMTSRQADYGLEGREELACRGYDPLAGSFFRCAGLDLFNDRAVEHLEALFRDLASYDIDGILFQDDLVLKYNEGFGDDAERLFEKEMGRSLRPGSLYIKREGAAYVDYTPGFWEWAAWKNRRLLYVAGRLKDAARKVNPELKFAMNFMYEAVLNPPYALAWLSQDLERAAEDHGFDYYAIMAYQRQMEEELGRSPAEVSDMIEEMAREAARMVGDAGRVLIKLQTIDWTTRKNLRNDEVSGLLMRVRGVEGIGIAVVPYRPDFPFAELGGATGMQ